MTGVEAPICRATDGSPEAKRTADLVNDFVKKAGELLKEHHPANMILTRGFAKIPHIDTMEEIYKLNCAAIATYPMYRGLAKLVGMNVLEAPPTNKAEFELLEKVFGDYDFFFVHIKHTDSRGEDGKYDAKVKVIEEVDQYIPRLRALNPDVIVVSGDHSTPSQLSGHSWHPVPFLLYSKYHRPDHVERFGERECYSGLLGTFPAMDTMPLMMANALKLKKYGA